MNGSLSLHFTHWQNGVESARDAILVLLQDHLARLTRAVLREYPIVQRQREVDSVLADLNVRLLGAINKGVKPENATEFLKFAAYRLRQLLRDEAVKLRLRGQMARFADSETRTDGVPEPRADQTNPSRLLEWTEFHEQILNLPDDERTIFDLHFFHQMPQSEIAELLQVEPKQVSRKWLAAAYKLRNFVPKHDPH